MNEILTPKPTEMFRSGLVGLFDDQLTRHGHGSLEQQELPVTLVATRAENEFVIIRATTKPADNQKVLFDCWFNDRPAESQAYCMLNGSELFTYQYGSRNRMYRQEDERAAEFNDRLTDFMERGASVTGIVRQADRGALSL